MNADTITYQVTINWVHLYDSPSIIVEYRAVKRPCIHSSNMLSYETDYFSC